MMIIIIITIMLIIIISSLPLPLGLVPGRVIRIRTSERASGLVGQKIARDLLHLGQN